jgi:hypothetical protein
LFDSWLNPLVWPSLELFPPLARLVAQTKDVKTKTISIKALEPMVQHTGFTNLFKEMIGIEVSTKRRLKHELNKSLAKCQE